MSSRRETATVLWSRNESTYTLMWTVLCLLVKLYLNHPNGVLLSVTVVETKKGQQPSRIGRCLESPLQRVERLNSPAKTKAFSDHLDKTSFTLNWLIFNPVSFPTCLSDYCRCWAEAQESNSSPCQIFNISWRSQWKIVRSSARFNKCSNQRTLKDTFSQISHLQDGNGHFSFGS